MATNKPNGIRLHDSEFSVGEDEAILIHPKLVHDEFMSFLESGGPLKDDLYDVFFKEFKLELIHNDLKEYTDSLIEMERKKLEELRRLNAAYSRVETALKR